MDLIACCVAAIGLHLGSAHIDVDPAAPKFTGVNPGVYAEFKNGMIAGTYRNSLARQSAYLGYKVVIARHAPFQIDVGVGAVTGYPMKVAPLVLPSLHMDLGPHYGVRVSYLPKIKFTQAHVVHVSLDYRF